MTEPVFISPAPPERPSQDYAAMRESGVELVRQLAGETWTDHNVHDPGITLLEAFCYAMTELGLRVQLDMADLLRSGEVNAPDGLVPAHEVLSVGPVTTADMHRLLIDHPLVSDALVADDAAGEVQFYRSEAPGPPFVYTPGGPPVHLRGLREVLIAFSGADPELDLDSNTYAADVTVGSETYGLEVALPHWDTEQAAPFRAGETVAAVSMLGAPDVWQPLTEEQTYFGEVEVQTGGGPTVVFWALLRITDPVPAADVAAVLAGAEAAVEALGAGSLIEEFRLRVRAADAAVSQVEHYVAGWRNLSEETVRLSAAREQEIAVGARIEITGGVDLEELLAEIFLAVDRHISPPLTFYSLAEMQARGRTVEEIFDGPLLRSGFLDDDELGDLTVPSAIYVSDILRIIMENRGGSSDELVAQESPTGRDIVAVTDLRLSNFVNNRLITGDARDCLRLVETDRYRPRLSLAKSRVTFVRDDIEVDYDRERVEALFQAASEEARDAAATDDPSPELGVPRGEPLDLEDYYPFQNDLPRLYGLGEAGLADGVGAERKAQALQAKGYLVLFEQFLSDLAAQLGNVNRFFSPAAGETATYFTRPLLDLPGVGEVLRQSPEAYGLALQEAVESRDRFLDRRNRMLDHLLARQGEQTVAWSQEAHRWGQKELGEIPPGDLPAARETRRLAVNARLLRDKAAYLARVPELNALRLQAFGSLLRRRPELLRLEEVALPGDEVGHRWLLAPDATADPVLRSSTIFASAAEAVAAAAEAGVLAAQVDFYRNVAVGGGNRRYQLADGPAATDRVVGESPTTFPNVPTTQAALEAAAALFADLRMDLSMTPMERRIAHLTGVRTRRRRRLLISEPDLLDLFVLQDDTGGDGVVEGWRFEAQGPDGPVALTGVGPFAGVDDAEAMALARQSIDAVVRYGLDEWNYELSAGGDAFELLDATGTAIAQSDGAPFADAAEAERAIAALIELMYFHCSGEGAHLVENLLLRPRQEGDEFLALPADDDEMEADPYSHRLTLVFPSGYSRDPADPPDAPPTEVAPHRFRDPEFRRHAERTVSQSCPAHLLPEIHWLDRDPSEEPAPGSFDGFEQRYFAWLRTVLVPGAPADARDARNRLVESINDMAAG